MLVTYPWHSKIRLLGCFTAKGRAQRLLYKGENTLGDGKLGDAAGYFARAAHAARSGKQARLEMIAVYASALVAEAQDRLERADQYMTFAAGLAEPLAAAGDEKAENVLQEKERLRELLVMKVVESKLKCIRIAGKLVDALTDQDVEYRARENRGENRLFDEAQAVINEQLGYRHWLTALVLATKAAALEGDDCVRLLKRAWQIALEYPHKASFVIKGIKAKLQELGEDGEDWKLAAV